jgi:hypothetical protein
MLDLEPAVSRANESLRSSPPTGECSWPVVLLKLKKRQNQLPFMFVLFCNSIIDELLAEPLPPPLHIV